MKKLITLALAPALAMSVLTGCDVNVKIGDGTIVEKPAAEAAKPAPGLTLAALKAAAARAETEEDADSFDRDLFNSFTKTASVDGFKIRHLIDYSEGDLSGQVGFGVEFVEFASDADAQASKVENETDSIPEMNIVYGKFLARTGFPINESNNKRIEDFITKIFEDAIANPVKEDK